jgi:hypothetical protein
MTAPKQTRTALRSGLDAQSQTVPGESPEAFAALQAEYFDRYQPTTPDQRFQVDNLIRNEWLLRRYHRVEAQLWTYQTSLCDGSGAQLGEAFTKAGATFMRLHRCIVAVQKAYQNAIAELERLQQASQPQPAGDQSAELASFLQTASQPPRDITRTPPDSPHTAPLPPLPARSERAAGALR